MVEFGSLFRAFKKPAEVAGAGALAASIAACGGGEAPKTPNTTPATPSPIVTPGEMPSMTASPSFEVTPSPVTSPSPEVTSTPTPTATETAKAVSPITKESVLKQLEAYKSGDKHALDAYNKAITSAQLKEAFDAFMASPSRDTLSSDYTDAVLEKLFTNSTNPEGTDANLKEAKMQSASANLTLLSLQAAEATGGDQAAVALAKDYLRYDVTKVFVGNIDFLITKLSS